MAKVTEETRKSNDFSCAERAEMMGVTIIAGQKPGIVMSSQAMRKAWQAFCDEQGIPTGGGGRDRFEKFGAQWGAKGF